MLDFWQAVVAIREQIVLEKMFSLKRNESSVIEGVTKLHKLGASPSIGTSHV